MEMVSAILGAVDKKSVHPALVFALIEIQGDEITMTALDFEIQVLIKKKLQVPSDFDQRVKFCFPVKKVFDFIKALPEEEELNITFDHEALKICIYAQRFRLEAAGFPEQDFPQFEVSESDSLFSINPLSLKSAIDSISFSMAHSDIRYYLNGMLWHIDGNTLVCVATDGHRMAVTTAEVAPRVHDGEKCTGYFILPRRAVFELNKLLTNQNEDVLVSVDNSLIKITVGHIFFTSKLIEGKFPDYLRVLPKDSGHKLELNKEHLKNALMQVQPIISQKTKGVELKFYENVLKIHAQNSQGEEVTVEVEFSGLPSDKNDSLSLGLNLSYIYDYLQTVREETVNFFIKNSKTGVLLSHNNITKYLVMPLTL